MNAIAHLRRFHTAQDRIALMSSVLVLNGLPDRDGEAMIVLLQAGFRPAEILERFDAARAAAAHFAAKYLHRSPSSRPGGTKPACSDVCVREGNSLHLGDFDG